MNFKVLSHAGLLVEHNGVQLVVDPWILGSCYWRSWWNFPEPNRETIENLRPQYIYLTHLHWDHFHGPSLKKLFDPSTFVIVPKVHSRRMVDDLNWLGFYNIIEISHGKDFKLGEDFTLASYQAGLGVDSALVLSGGGVNILNANDCKLFGWPLRQIQRRFPKFDFVLRSHSSASALPYCVENFKTLFPNYRSPEDYIDEFCYFSLAVNANYAIPFASNHCFLHRETIRFNSMSVSPTEIPSRYRELAKKYSKSSECIIMSPGDAWSQRDGFNRTPFDYRNKNFYISMLGEKHKEKLESQYFQEDSTLASFDLFQDYFSQFIKSIPMVLRKSLNLSVQFRVCDSSGVKNWLIDAARGKVVILDKDEHQFPVIQTPALVLNDCCSKRMFSAWTPSKRLNIHLRSDSDLRRLQVFFLLLDLYELDTLPLRKNVSWRGLSTRVSRWRELLEAAKLFCKHMLLRRRFVFKNLYRL